jgi:hypothetical protein
MVSGILRASDSPSKGRRVTFNDEINVRMFKQGTPELGKPDQDLIMIDSPEAKTRDPSKYLVEMPDVLPHIIVPRDDRRGREYPEMMYAQHPIVEFAKSEYEQPIPFLNRVEALRSWQNTLPIPPTATERALPWNMGPAPYLPHTRYHYADIEVTISQHAPALDPRSVAWKLLGDFCEAYGFILNVAAGAEGESPWDWIDDYLAEDWQAIAWDYMADATGHKARLAFLECETDEEDKDNEDEDEATSRKPSSSGPDGRPTRRRPSKVSGRAKGTPRARQSESEHPAETDNDADTPPSGPISLATLALRLKRAASGPGSAAKRRKTN